MKHLSDQILNDLKELVGDQNLKLGKNLYESVESGISGGNLDAAVAVSPTDTQQLSNIIAYCNKNRIAIIPHGGRTGLSGGAISYQGQLIVQTSKLNKIIELDLVAGTATVESGVKLEVLETVISAHAYTVGVDLAARGSATIGGMVSTNAGGTQAFRNGNMRHRILGLEVVLPSGQILSDLKKVIKANEGYDVKQLIIGAEGTLGIITKVVLNLLPKNNASSTSILSCENAQSAAQVFQRLRSYSSCLLLSAEIMWPLYAKTTAEELKLTNLINYLNSGDNVFVIIELFCKDDSQANNLLEDILEKLFDEGLINNALIAKNANDVKDFWAIREESFLCDDKYPHGFWFDVSVPLANLDDYSCNLFEKIKHIDPNLNVFLFGHLGDGNLHLTISSGKQCPELEAKISAAVYEDLNQIGGSFSAEHGIGEQKTASLETYVDAQKLELMKLIKAALDPNCIMNPGKVLTCITRN